MPTFARALEERYDEFIREQLDFAEAQAKLLASGQTYRFGPLQLALQVQGQRLSQRLGLAIRHAIGSTTPQIPPLRVIAIDGSVSGHEPPRWNLPTYAQRHLERLHVSSDRQRLLHHNPDTTNWTILDHQRNLALTWTASAELLPDWEDSFPLRTVVHWMSTGTAAHLAHAAVIESGGRGVLLTGRGGSGKSTTTVAAILSALRTCGDDFVMVEDRGDNTVAHCLYDTVKLDNAALHRFPSMQPIVANPERDSSQKARIHLSDHLPQSLIASTSLAGIVVPLITDDNQPSIHPISPALALRALAPSTLFLLRGEESVLAQKLSQLVRRLPTWQLRLNHDPLASAAFLGAWLERQS